jgi:hypothetical protein
MAKQKFDGLVEAVRYGPDGQVVWVRAYMRRGPTFSDWVLLDRQMLISKLKDGKKFVIGSRLEQMASTFEVTGDVRLANQNGREIIVSGNTAGQGDHLEGAPQV